MLRNRQHHLDPDCKKDNKKGLTRLLLTLINSSLLKQVCVKQCYS